MLYSLLFIAALAWRLLFFWGQLLIWSITEKII